MANTPITWNNANIIWNDNPYTWDDIALVKEVIKGGRATDDEYLHPLLQDEKKKKRLVKLIYKTQGKVLKEEKEIKEIKITVKDVKILAKEVLGINVTIL